MALLERMIGWIVLWGLASLVAWILYKTGLASKEAFEGKETKGIKIAKYTILGMVVVALAALAYVSYSG